MIDSIPVAFSRFEGPLEWLMSKNPSGVALAGSYGDLNKLPDSFSDLDILFVFNTTNILNIIREFMESLSNDTGLIGVYLGPHPQFGHLVNLYFSDNPTHWIDVGIMDENFACNYLTGLPITIIKGSVNTTGIPPNHYDQTSHLAKKIIKAKQRNDIHLMKIYCYRYAQWANIDISQEENVKRVVQCVFDDVKSKFPHFIQDKD